MKPPLKPQFCGFRFLGARCHCPRHHRIRTISHSRQGKNYAAATAGFLPKVEVFLPFISIYANQIIWKVIFSTMRWTQFSFPELLRHHHWFGNKPETWRVGFEMNDEKKALLGLVRTWEPGNLDGQGMGGTRTVVRCTCSDWKEWGWSIGGDYWAAVFWFINWDCGRPIGPTVVDPANDKGHLRRKGL